MGDVMTAARLLLELAARNIVVRADGDALRFAPAEALTNNDRDSLHGAKPKLLAMLRHVEPDRGAWRFAFRNSADEAQPGYVAYAVEWRVCFPRVAHRGTLAQRRFRANVEASGGHPANGPRRPRKGGAMTTQRCSLATFKFATRLVRGAVETYDPMIVVAGLLSHSVVGRKLMRAMSYGEGRTSATTEMLLSVYDCRRYYPLLRNELRPTGTVAIPCTVCLDCPVFPEPAERRKPRRG